jgi:hypothetical protein
MDCARSVHVCSCLPRIFSNVRTDPMCGDCGPPVWVSRHSNSISPCNMAQSAQQSTAIRNVIRESVWDCATRRIARFAGFTECCITTRLLYIAGSGGWILRVPDHCQHLCSRNARSQVVEGGSVLRHQLGGGAAVTGGYRRIFDVGRRSGQRDNL